MKFLMHGLLLALFLAAAPAPQGVEFTRAQAGRITHFVGKILENLHYRQSPLNNAVSETFLHNYLDTLDYNHLVFLQPDVEEFKSRYGQTLDDATLQGEVAPAYRIFDRYLQRLGERNTLVTRLLAEKFDYTKDESILANRHKAPWPADEAEAESLWRGRIKYELLQGRLSKEKEEETLKRITRRYERLEKTMREFDAEEILQTYLSALSHSYDPHSDYLSPTEAANFDIQHISLSLSGIGATLQWDDGYTKVVSLVPGGPAALGKQIKPNDRIVAVAQGDGEPVDVVEMRLNKVVQMIRGKRGTKVTLTVIPSDSPDSKKQVAITRDEIKLKEQFAKARVIDHTDDAGQVRRLGVVTLPQFYDNCAAHVESLVLRLKKEKVAGIVLDLRRNGGGILEESVSLTGLFLKKGPVVQVKDSRKQIQVHEDKDVKSAWDGPLLVLVGRLSASASEITAAALQDYGRALIVGDQATHGKGTVQQVLDLERWMRPDPIPNPGKLKITVSKFYRVAGGTTQKQGVHPDIILPSVYDYLDIGESSLDHALEPDSIPPADYKPLQEIKPLLPQLQKRSAARVGQSRDFAYLLEDIAEVKKRKEDKMVSLNEASRIAEKDDQQNRADARKKERAARKPQTDKVFDLTWEAAEKDQPLVAYAGRKAEKERAEAVPPAAGEDPEDPDSENDLGYDAQLTEALDILGDFAKMLGVDSVKSSETVALKQGKVEPSATP